MKYNIHVTQAAERDMANAYDYIDLVLKNLKSFPTNCFPYGESASPSL